MSQTRKSSALSNFEQNFRNSVSLTDLGVNDNDIPFICEAIKRANILQVTNSTKFQVYLDRNDISDDGVAILCQFLNAYPEYKNHLCFFLRNNNISEKGIDLLCQTLPGQSRLFLNEYFKLEGNPGYLTKFFARVYTNELDLTKQRITDNNIEQICEFLKTNPQIKKVNLAQNSISDAGAIQLSETLKNCPHITTLNLSYNDIDYIGLEALADLDNVTSLNVLGNKGLHPELESSQEWFVSFMKFFGLWDLGGECEGLSYFIIPKLVKDSSIKEIIRFNAAFKRLFEIYKMVGESILHQLSIKDAVFKNTQFNVYEVLKNAGKNRQHGYFHYTKENLNIFLSMLETELKKLPAKDLALLTKLFKDYLKPIHKYQINPLKKLFFDENTFCIPLRKLRTETEFADLLEKVKEEATRKNLYFAIKIDENQHATTIGFDPGLDCWSYTDANGLPINFNFDHKAIARKTFDAHQFNSKRKNISIAPFVFVDKKNKAKAIEIFKPFKGNFFGAHWAKIILGTCLFAFISILIITSLAYGGGLIFLPLAAALGISSNAVLGIALSSAIILGASLISFGLKIKDLINGIGCIKKDSSKEDIKRASSSANIMEYLSKNKPEFPLLQDQFFDKDKPNDVSAKEEISLLNNSSSLFVANKNENDPTMNAILVEKNTLDLSI